MRHVLRLALFLFLAAAPAAPSLAAPAAPGGTVSFMISGEPAEKAAYQDLIRAFEKRNPRVRVELVYIPDAGAFPKRLLADIIAGTPPDVFLLNYRRYAPLAARDVLEPLDAWVAKSRTVPLADFYPEAIAAFRWNQKLMGIPQNLSSLVVYYNKNLFDAAKVPYPSPTWTWDDFVRTAKALTRDTNGDGVADQYGLGTEASVARVAPFVWGNGGEIVDDGAAPTKLMLDQPAAREALEKFVALQTVHHVVPNRVTEAARGHEARFLDGQMAMLLNSRRGVPTYRTIASFQWDVAPLPRMKTASTLLHSDGFFMAAGSKNKPAAWAFIEYANSVAGQQLLARTGRTVPSRRSVAQSPAFLASHLPPKSGKVFLDVIPTLRALPVFPMWTGIESILSEELERAYHGDVPLDEAIQRCNDRTKPNLATR